MSFFNNGCVELSSRSVDKNHLQRRMTTESSLQANHITATGNDAFPHRSVPVTAVQLHNNTRFCNGVRIRLLCQLQARAVVDLILQNSPGKYPSALLTHHTTVQAHVCSTAVPHITGMPYRTASDLKLKHLRLPLWSWMQPTGAI